MAALLANNKEQGKGVDKDKKKNSNSFSTKRKKIEQEVEDKGKAALLGPVRPTKIEKKRKQ
jgi:hypothetical protein